MDGIYHCGALTSYVGQGKTGMEATQEAYKRLNFHRSGVGLTREDQVTTNLTNNGAQEFVFTITVLMR